MKNSLIFGAIIAVIAVSGFFIFKNQSSKGDLKFSTIEGSIVSDTSAVRIAGSTSLFVEFTQSEFEKAKISDKIIFLDFYANWCPICRVEAPFIESAFNELTNENLVGFRVNFNDSETDNDEKKLAKEFNVPYQHTKIILQNGAETARYPDQWDKDTAMAVLSSL